MVQNITAQNMEHSPFVQNYVFFRTDRNTVNQQKLTTDYKNSTNKLIIQIQIWYKCNTKNGQM